MPVLPVDISSDWDKPVPGASRSTADGVVRPCVGDLVSTLHKEKAHLM